MKRFEEFVKDECTFVYEDYDNIEMLLDGFELSEEQKNAVMENLHGSIMENAIQGMINDDWFWQHFHETMDMYLRDSLRTFLVKE